MIVVSNSSIEKVRFQAYEFVLSDINILQFAIFSPTKRENSWLSLLLLHKIKSYVG